MANLEAKSYMSTWQLAIVIFVTCVGAQVMLTPRSLITKAEHGAGLSVIVGGVLFYSAVCMMLKLAKEYPDETFVEYAPRLFGKAGGSIVVFLFNLLFFFQVIQIFSGVGKIITFYMFDQTPPEVVILALLVVCAYCALQDWGTILRLQQFMFLIAYSILIMVWMSSILNFQPENLLPLWPVNIKAVISSGFSTWNMYSGYECVLLLMPLVYRQASLNSLIAIIGGSFGCLTIIFLMITVIIIGVLTVEAAKNLLYPALIVIRSVELPGTFIERLENYLLLAWIPVVFDTLAAMMYFMGEICMRYWRHADHRPWVLFLLPIIYISSVFLDNQQLYDRVSMFTTWIGLLFSFGVIPASLVLSWRQKRKAGTSCD
ncbi:MAG: spore germination protein [Pelosinus sp.]|jgi:spore germination protein|nr:spore germination protein [Pelosinus sp.]